MEHEYVSRFPGFTDVVRSVLSQSESFSSTKTFRIEDDDESSVQAVRDESREFPSIGHYKIQQLLGIGGFGSVFRAFDPGLDRVVALKLTKTNVAEAKQRLAHEAMLCAPFKHPQIPQVFAFEQYDDWAVLVREFVDGSRWCPTDASNGVPILKIAECVVRLCDAVGHMHSKGVIHRDIKPANIVVNGEGKPSIVGFSIASHKSELLRSTSREIVGTASYMSPEQAEGRNWDIDERTDIWSIGVTLYETLTGQRPFSEKTLSKTFDAIRKAVPQQPSLISPRIPSSLSAICLRCLSKNKHDRYQSALELKIAIRECIENLPNLSEAQLVDQSTQKSLTTDTISDWEWAIQQRDQGVFREWDGKYVGVLEKRVIEVGDSPNQLRDKISKSNGVPSERVVVMYIPQLDEYFG